MSVDETVHTVYYLGIWVDLLFMSSVCAMRLAAPTLNAYLFTVQVFVLGCVLRWYVMSFWQTFHPLPPSFCLILYITDFLRGRSFCHSDLSLSSILCLLPVGKGVSACLSSP